MYSYCNCEDCKRARNKEFNIAKLYGAKLREETYESPFKVIEDYIISMKAEIKKNNYSPVNKFSLGDFVHFNFGGWPCYSGVIVKVDNICGIIFYDIKSSNSYGKIFTQVLEKNIEKGKDNNMTNITVDINCNGGMSINPNVFYIAEPKFKVGDKVKRVNKNWYGVVSNVESNIRIHKSKNASKYQRDSNEWIYTITYEGGSGTCGSLKDIDLVKDERPETDKYFDFLDKQGVKLDRTRYTWKSFNQETVTFYNGNVNINDAYFPNYYGNVSWGWKGAGFTETKYYALLCDKSTTKIVKFEGTQVGTDKLPAISEKC